MEDNHLSMKESSDEIARLTKLRAEMQAKGYTQATAWVPADKREELLKYAAKLRWESQQ